jgi:hypothetical protein
MTSPLSSIRKTNHALWATARRVSCKSIVTSARSRQAEDNVSKRYGCKDAIGKNL